MHQLKVHRAFFLLFSLCIFTLSLGQFSAVYSFGQGSIYLFDALIALFDLFGLSYLAKLRQLKIPLPVIFLFGFVALGFNSLLFTPLHLEPTEFLTALAYPLRFLAYISFALTVWNFVRAGFFKIDHVYRLIIYSGLSLFVAGIFQLIFLPDLEILDSSLGWDPHKSRMASTFFDPNFLGMYFVLCLATIFKLIDLKQPASLTVSLQKPTTRPDVSLARPKPQPIIYVASLIFLLGILLTFSRSAWLAAAVLIFFVGLRNKVVLLASASIVLLAVFAVPRIQTRISGITDPQDSASFRLISWQNTWEIIQDNWVFGVGYNAFRYAQRDYGFLDDYSFSSRSGAGSDSSLLLIWSTSGIFGFVFLSTFCVRILYNSVSSHTLVDIGLILGITINSLFINSLLYPQILTALLILLTRTHGDGYISNNGQSNRNTSRT